MKVWRTKFLKHQIYIPSEREQEYLRKGYFGGRCQFIGYGEKAEDGLYHDVNYIDVNSMYPSEMFGNDYPIGELFKVRNHKHFNDIRKHNNGDIAYGMYRVSFDIPDKNVKYPPLINERTKLGFNFGNHSDEIYLTSIDLGLIEELDGTYAVIDGYYTLEKVDIFLPVT